LISVAIVVVLQAIFTYAPFMQALFNTPPLDPEMWWHIAGASVVLFLLVEVEKAIFRRPAKAPALRGVPAAPAAGAAAVVAPGDWVRPVVAGLLGLLIIVVSGAFYLHTRVSLTREEASAGRTVDVSGVIVPVAQTPINAPAAGVVATLSCDVGAQVEKGETCATLAPSSSDEALAREKSALAAAERQLTRRERAQARVQANLDRREARSGRRAASRKALSAARRALARARAQVEPAEAEVALRREAVTKAEAGRVGAAIVAPVAGFVIERRAAVGARVETGAPLFMIGDAKIVRFHAKAEGEGALAIAPGAEAVVTSESVPGRTFSGKVAEARRSELGASVDVVVEVNNPELALRPGMAASARIGIEERAAASSAL
ncbi:MAG: efflux RND transporter periplasmic adaptor subunit, partial [Methylocystis sp.]|uniref:efflux RND transporter periplasmic adaptor subunit n=1 Tax=Methylocystis sp. TaxID=1911079 RepID=UPI003DA3DD4A